MKLKDYQRARNDGLQLALKIVENGGASALKKEIKFRGTTKIETNLTMEEIEEASKPMRGFINEVHILLWLSVLHDEFDFGKKRLNRAMDRFEQIYSSIEDGYAGLNDYLELLQNKMKKILKAEYIIQDDKYEKKEDL